MVATTGITETIRSLSDLQQRCQLQQAQTANFFDEWLNPPAITQEQQARIAQIKQRYDYHRVDGLLLEGTINLLVVSPLLELAGFLDPPFRVRSPYSITLNLDDPEENVRGFVDALVVQDRLWILTVESKKTSISVGAALPQLLAYLLASPSDQNGVYGMVTNGDEFIFLKLVMGEVSQYDVSRTFSLIPRRHELGDVLAILQRLGEASLGEQ